jgi:hypothetical protein
VNANEFIQWFGSELQGLLGTINEKNWFEQTHDLIDRAILYLSKLSQMNRTRVLKELMASHQTHLIGHFRVPFDIQEEADIIEEILATIEGYLEG